MSPNVEITQEMDKYDYMQIKKKNTKIIQKTKGNNSLK